MKFPYSEALPSLFPINSDHLIRREVFYLFGPGVKNFGLCAQIRFARSRANGDGSPWRGGPAVSRSLCRFAGGDRRHIRLNCKRGSHVSKSVLDAIREGDWFFEPDEIDSRDFHATTAIPGSRQKLEVLAARARAGLPLWHEKDRAGYDQTDDDD